MTSTEAVRGEAVRGEVTRGSPPPWRATAAAFAGAVESGRLDLPLPGSGTDPGTLGGVRGPGRGGPVAGPAGRGARGRGGDPGRAGRPGAAAGQPVGRVGGAIRPARAWKRPARRRGWRLRGTKQYCSGARACTHALVTAAAPDGMRLFAVTTGSPDPGAAAPGRPPAWRAATPWTSTSTTSRRAGRAARRLHWPARVRPRRRGRRRLLVRRGPRGRPAPCWPPRPQRDVGPARAGPPGRGGHRAAHVPGPLWTRPRTRSTPTPTTCRDARPRPGAAGAGPGRGGRDRGHGPGRPGARRRAAGPRRGARPPGRRPDRLPAPASCGTGPRRAGRAGRGAGTAW